ncbi:hypothetical protein MAR_005881 [Mya arenaria]|uniref:CARD domain-containing protein n=1 Tax=Mya arenaria TaxID=6604 RepID=A0ABY7F904_MYAAR|nr:hypothetical protein MAR_005881 [Mya arenaria]
MASLPPKSGAKKVKMVESTGELDDDSGISPENEERIRKNFLYLREELAVEDLKTIVDFFIERDHVESDFFEEISSKARRHQVDAVVLKMFRLPIDTFDDFVRAIESDSQKHYLSQTLKFGGQGHVLQYSNLSKETKLQRILEHHQLMVTHVDPDQVAPYLFAFGGCSHDQYEAITSTSKTAREKCEELFNVISRCPESNYDIYVTALKERKYLILLYDLQTGRTSRVGTEEASCSPGQETQRKIVQSKNVTDESAIQAQIQDSSRIEITLKLGMRNKNTDGKLARAIEEFLGNLNEELVDAELLVVKVKTGSIILTIDFIGGAKYNVLVRSKGISGIVQSLLEALLKIEKFSVLLPSSQILCGVYVRPVTADEESKANAGMYTDCRDLLEKNREFLKEELDALAFTQALLIKEVLTQTEVEMIVLSETSRSRRMERLLDLLLRKDLRALNVFFDEIRKTQSDFVTNHLWPDIVTIRIANDVRRFYHELASEICLPILIPYMASSLLKDHLKDLVERYSDNAKLAKLAVQFVIGRNEADIVRFVHTLRENCMMPSFLEEIALQEDDDEGVDTDAQLQQMRVASYLGKFLIEKDSD